ncbi:MAG: 3'(2'),5'-bisphosphate nucleotidase [Myxococcota bacterium]
MSYETERRFAVEAVERAAYLCAAVQREWVAGSALAKDDESPVTVADFGAQAVVSHTLAAALPDVPLVAEEEAEALRRPENAALAEKVVEAVQQSLPSLESPEILDLIDRGTYGGGRTGRHWTLDPIDGTKGFLRQDQYAVALALIEDGQLALGALGCPNLPLNAADPDGERGCLFVAVKGEGSFMRPLGGGEERRIRVADVRKVAEARLCESVEAAHSSRSDTARVAEILGITAPPFRIDSQCKYAAVARGDASIYLRLPTRKDYEEKIWDHAAGSMVVSEAGGRITDADGKDLDFSLGRTLRDNTGVVVTNGHLHDEVVSAVKQALSRSG